MLDIFGDLLFDIKHQNKPLLERALLELKEKKPLRFVDPYVYIAKFLGDEKLAREHYFSFFFEYFSIEHDFEPYWIAQRSRSFEEVYYDSCYNFLLVTKGRFYRPAAIVGFSHDPRFGSLVIKQLQGFQIGETILSRIRWEKMLVAMVVDWAREHGAKKVEILPARSSRWYPAPSNILDPHGPVLTLSNENKKLAERLHMRYDVTARRCGFRLDPITKRFSLNI